MTKSSSFASSNKRRKKTPLNQKMINPKLVPKSVSKGFKSNDSNIRDYSFRNFCSRTPKIRHFNPQRTFSLTLKLLTIIISLLITSRSISCQSFHSFQPNQPSEPYQPPVKCPPEEELAPCTCDDKGDLECYGSNVTNDELQSVFDRLLNSNQKHFHALKLYKTELRSLYHELFTEITFACIDINGNQNLSLNSIHRTTLYKSKDIMTSFKYTGLMDAYMIEKSENDGAIFENVDGFMSLQSFWVTSARIPKIQRSALGRCELPSVKTVYLPKNNIEAIGDYAFYRLPNLTYLNLKDNEISRISNYTFSFEKSNDDVLILDLSGNIITSESIDKGAFEMTQRPLNLNLYYNLITFLDEHTFKPILSNPKSQIIVTNNPIICDCRMKWLLDDAHNYMDRVHGLMCGGKNELWYFTPEELDNECNETVLTIRFYAYNGACSLKFNHFSQFLNFFNLNFSSIPNLTILNCELIPKIEFIVKYSNEMLKYFNETLGVTPFITFQNMFFSGAILFFTIFIINP